MAGVACRGFDGVVQGIGSIGAGGEMIYALIIALAGVMLVLVSVLVGYHRREISRHRLILDWDADVRDLGIAHRRHIQALGGDFTIDVPCRRRLIEQWKNFFPNR